MPPSQLKRLKASLREQGITGPQKSKKQKKNHKSSGTDQREKKAAALASIREASNPFDFKSLVRPKKFDYVSSQPQNGDQVLGRPGVSKSRGEEMRRKTLLPEMSRRSRVGGILDRRIGENDPTMTVEDRMMARFEREQQRKRGGNVFDLEEAEDDVELTHGGRSLKLDDERHAGDYDAASVDASSDGEEGFLRRKRLREDFDTPGGHAVQEDGPEHKRSKKEIMEEVIAKSKQHKYERQQQKEDDDELREELDKGLPDILAALAGHITNKALPPSQPPESTSNNDFGINPERAALLASKSGENVDKEYDSRVRQLLYDQKSKPTERTKTEEEKAQEEASRLEELEEKRMRRMRGEISSDSDNEAEKDRGGDDDEIESLADDAAQFGIRSVTLPTTRPEGVDDEDDFLMEDDLVASDSEADMSEASEDGSGIDDTMVVDDDDDFLKDVRPQPAAARKATDGILTMKSAVVSSKLAYTYPCPRSHDDLLGVLENVPATDIPTVVQRIRALYHAGLNASNREKLSDFACALVDHISYLSNQTPPAQLSLIETLIRHIHSMSRAYPVEVATRFRHHLKQLQLSNNPTAGDLTILSAIGSIYPTSDHFHQVVTPAITLMARWLGLTTPQHTKHIAIGAYIGALCIQFQRLSKRYIPELVRYTVLCLDSPHLTPSLITEHSKNILAMADLWTAHPSFIEIVAPFLSSLQRLHQTSALQRLNILLHNARLRRRPQELHHHKPLPIKTSIPKFEETFDPNKHYDPDRERAEANRLRKEYKRERKGALRELRKDANFIAREKLREKKEKDRKYEEKYRRLVAEIQGEEGREANNYEREKRARKRRG